MTSGNPILDKNLDCIARYNPTLKQELLALPGLNHSIKLVETNLKEPNLTYDGLIMHAQDGAELEAKNAFNQIKNTQLSMHIVFGLGIGHLFKEFCIHSKGKVFLYEPNLEILRVTLELVDFSKELSQNNVFVFSNFQTLKEVFGLQYQYNAEVTFTVLGSYKRIYADSLNDILGQINTIVGLCLVDYNTIKQEGVHSMSMVLENLPYTLEGTPLYEFKDVYKGKTALIVSAGPTLDSCIETIKKNRDKVVIFCVGTAFKALANNGIRPDFLNLIEIHDCSEQVKGYDLSDINFILEPYTNNVFQKLKVKNKLLFPTNRAHSNNYWAYITGVDISPYIAKGTVSYSALYSAKILGCSKIILVGQDLAYLDNKCYSSASAYSELSFVVNPETGRTEFQVKDYDKYIQSLMSIGQEEVQPWHKEYVDQKIRSMNEQLIMVKGISGGMVPTQGGYATFIEHFKEFAYYNKDLKLINTSMLGAQIDGFENIPIEKALEDENIIEKPDLVNNFKYDKDKILNNLEKDENILKEVISNFAKAKEYIFKYDRELQRRKVITNEANKYFKNLLSLYERITDAYYNTNIMYQMLAFNEHIEIQYVIKGTEKVDTDRIKLVYSLLKIYYAEVEKKVNSIIDCIERQKRIISEGVSAKS